MPKKPNKPQAANTPRETAKEREVRLEREKVNAVLLEEAKKVIRELADHAITGGTAAILDRLDPELHPIIVIQLTERNSWLIDSCFEKFQNLNKEVAMKLIEIGKGGHVANSLEKFQGLDKEVAMKLIKAELGMFVACSPEKFQNLDKEVVIKLIEAKQGWLIIRILEEYQGLDKEVVIKLIEAGEGYRLAKNLEKLTELNEEDKKEIVRTLYFKWLKEGEMESALNLSKKFPAAIKNIPKDKEYVQVFSALCEHIYPEFQTYLEISDDHQLTEQFKNEFYAGEQKITHELLLKFESLIRFAEHHVSQTLKDKLKEWGLNPDSPRYKERLMEEERVELRRFMEEKQAEMRAKIEAIASPELIRAYQEQEGEADFLTQAA